MAAQSLYEMLFDTDRLPAELNDEAERKRLTGYLDSIIGISHHPRTQLLLGEGQDVSYLYFLEQGMARGYTYNPETQEEHTVLFWDEGSVFTDPLSFFNNLPAGLNLEIMAGSQLLFISHRQLMELYRSFPYAEIFTVRMIAYYAFYFAKRSHDLVNLSAWDRYKQLLRSYPGIELKVAKKIIASYIDIAPQSLSRLLKENGHP